jgi:ABC-type bacteriocin/lantibiotic exporter with double-glycine peptidase domain
VSTQGRVQEIQKLLPRVPTMQQIEQARGKLDALRTENKIWYNVINAEPQDIEDSNGNAATGSQAAIPGATGSGKQ